MFCSKCGKEIHNEAVFCPFCGCATNNNTTVTVTTNTANSLETEESGIANGAIICAFLVPIVGLILGIIGTVKYKTPSLKNKCIAAIPISVFFWISGTIGLMMMYYY